MAVPGEGGRVYERGLVEALKAFGYVPQNYQPAESDDTRPDIEMTVNGISAGVEVKLDSKAAVWFMELWILIMLNLHQEETLGLYGGKAG
jgi:hypothetical protein